MTDKPALLEKLLERFKFRNVISLSGQKYVISSMRKRLISTLKSLNEYSFFYGLVLGIFFRARRMGMRLTVTQSAFILGIISTIAAIAVAGGIALTPALFTPGEDALLPENKKINRTYKKPEQGYREKNKLIDVDAEKTRKQKKPAKKYRLGIELFGNENIGSDKSKRITGRIKMRLMESLGRGAVLSLGVAKRKHVNLILTGSVGRLGSLIMISAKLIDVEKGRAILITSENIKSEDEINRACDRISKKISMKIRQ